MKTGVWLLVVFGLMACEHSGETASEAESLKKGHDTAANKLADSAKAKGERTFKKVNDKLANNKNSKDSLRDSIK